MKHLFGAAALAVGAFAFSCFGGTQAAEAGTVHLGSGSSNFGPNQTGSGGEFSFTSSDLSVPAAGANVVPSGWLLQTFCLEYDEHVSANTEYYYSIDTTAYFGGVNVSGLGNDPLDDRTAWLYTQFWSGRNDGVFAYAYTGIVGGQNRSYYAGALQDAIWYLEGEIGSVSGQALTYVNAANTYAAGGIGNVRVLNLWSSATIHDETTARQSMLVMVVPLPSAAWLGLGMMSVLGVVGVIRRRKRQALA